MLADFPGYILKRESVADMSMTRSAPRNSDFWNRFTARAALLLAVGALAACSAGSAQPSDSEVEQVAPAATPTGDEDVSLWTSNDGTATIKCADRNDYFTAAFNLPIDNSDPLVEQLGTTLQQANVTGRNVLVVSLAEHANWPETDEGDYFSGITLDVPSGTLDLDYVKNGPGEVLRKAGLLSPIENEFDKTVKDAANELHRRMADRQSEEPAIYYLMTTENLTEVRSAFGKFPGKGGPCSR